MNQLGNQDVVAVNVSNMVTGGSSILKDFTSLTSN